MNEVGSEGDGMVADHAEIQQDGAEANEKLNSSGNGAGVDNDAIDKSPSTPETFSSNELVSAFRAFIKELSGQGARLTAAESRFIQTLDFHIISEEVFIEGSSYIVRRVHILGNQYNVGWVVESDLNFCMLCHRRFGWLLARPKHHCHACGSLVCHECSPYTAKLPFINGDKQSRVCKGCIAVKLSCASPSASRNKDKSSLGDSYTVFSSPDGKTDYTFINETRNINAPIKTPSKSPVQASHAAPAGSTAGVDASYYHSSISASTRKRLNELRQENTDEVLIKKYLEELEKFEKEQAPKYEDCYRYQQSESFRHAPSIYIGVMMHC